MRSRCLRPPGQRVPALAPRSVQNGVYQSQYWPPCRPGHPAAPRWPPQPGAASGPPRPRPRCRKSPRPRGDACGPDPEGLTQGRPGPGVSGSACDGRESRQFGLGRPRVDSWLVSLYNLGRSLHLSEHSGPAFVNASFKGLLKGSR